MKRHLATAVAIALIFLLSAGQIPVLCLSLNAPPPSRGAELSAPPRTSRALRQAPPPTPRPAGESATLLPDGRTLFLGGESPEGPRAMAEIRDDRSGAVTRLSEGLKTARSWHTATVLPDGLVLILGGVGVDGQVVEGAELFDPENQSFQLLPATGLTPRAYHMATLLTDGRLLVTGGTDNKERAVKRIETWEADSKTAGVLKAKLQIGRRKATAALQADGTVFLAGGLDQQETPVSGSEIYEPASDTVTWTPTTGPASDEGSARLLFSSPTNGDLNVDPKVRLSLRFSKRLKPESINRQSVKLSGPRGEVPSKIVSAENGRLLFVTPLAALAADSSYNLQVEGAAAIDDQQLEFTAINFKTKPEISCPNEPLCGGAGPQIIDADTWIPSASNFKGAWTSGRRESSSENLPALQAAAGETALAGQVLALGGSPLSNVTLQIADRIAVTDGTGRFLLSGLQSGRHPLTIQGHTASRPGKMYGTFDVLVDVAAGKTTVLPYKIWLPVLDEQNSIPLPIPTHRELGVTTPRVPGMEVRVPSAAVLRMPAGAHHSHGLTRRELKSIAITPIPSDRTPFPLPPGVNDALVFTLQLHGARIEGLRGEKRPGLRIVYPNYQNLPAGDRVDFWNYDPAGPGWYMYGHGTVTPNRQQVVPDPGVELQSMYCISLMNKGDAPGVGPNAGNGTTDGDPVDLGTGLFVYNKTDLVLPDVMPIALSRTYRQNDSVERSFGKGMTNPYDMYVFGNTFTYAAIILPDGGRIEFNGVDAQFECTSSPTRFYKATMRMISGVGPNGAWEVKLTDGTVYQFGIKVLWGDIFGPHHTITALSVIQDRFGNKLTISRDADFRMSRVTSPNGRWIQFSYSDTSKRIAQATDNTGRTVSYTYDTDGRLWKVTDAKGGITEHTYDASHRMLTIKNPRNIVYLTNQYDPASGRITRQTLPDTGVYQFAYVVDAQGKITQTDVTDPRNHIRRSTFNSSRFTLSDTFALGTPQQQIYTYERQPGTNFILNVTDPLGRVTAMTYNALGNMTSVTRLAGTPDAISASLTYDPVFNQVATITDPLNHTTSFAYNTSGLLESVRDPLNKQTTFTYNSAGQLLTATDPLERTIQFGYDSGDLVTITDAMNRVVTRYVDAAGRVTQITNPLGETTRYEFDSVNRASQVTNAMGGVGTVSRDANGNILSFTDARNSVTSYIYDDMDRVSIRRDPLLHDEVYQYDLNGNLAQVTDRKNQLTTFTYDALDRLTQVRYADNSTTTYTYDSVNRITQVVDSLSGTITYGYDNLDRLTSETTVQGSVTYVYDAAGRLTSMTVTGQPAVNYSYDNADRVTQITQGSATVTIAYDDIGRRTSLTLPNGVVTEYGYDVVSHLTSLTYKHNGSVLGDLTYEYDAAGRRTKMGGSFARSLSPEPLSSATYNAANQQLTFGGQTLAYDLNGNLTSDGVNSYTWDARNQLTLITGPDVNASFQYGASGERTSKDVNGATTGFLYDGANVVQEQSSQNGIANILSGGVDEVFSRSDSAGSFSPLLDGLGSSLMLTDATGNVQTQYAYGAFGQATTSGPASNNSSQYTGRENDGTGLQYNRARYYSPALQRFISEDPIGLLGGDNQYAYVGNNPIGFTDPSGLDQSGPVNYLRDPFSVDHVLLNAGANTISDLLFLDFFAKAAWDLGNHCLPASERAWAGVKLIGGAALVAGGGVIGRGIGRGIGAARRLLGGGGRGGIAPVLQGQAGVARAVAEIESAGGSVLGREITLDVMGLGRTRIDLLAKNANGLIEFIEVKNGLSAALNANQARLFPLIEQMGAIPRGANAAMAGLTPGEPIAATIIRVIHYIP